MGKDDYSTDILAGFNGGSTVIPSRGYAVITDGDSTVSVPASAIHLTTGDKTAIPVAIVLGIMLIIFRKKSNR